MEIPLPNLPYTRTYRMSMETIAQLSYLAEKFGKDQSKILREAIDEYYCRHVEDEPVNEAQAE